ncbi:MAG: 4-alpha-glucanotransferase [Gammaproteobacteria bacterium]
MNTLNQLAEKLGFLPSYINCFGDQVTNFPEALQSLVGALGYDTSSEEKLAAAATEIDNQSWLNVLADTIVIGIEGEDQDITFSYSGDYTEVSWQCLCDNGTKLSGRAQLTDIVPLENKTIAGNTYQKYRLRLSNIPMGYQQLTIIINDTQYDCHLIAAPRKCYSPADANFKRIWGLAAQLYSLSSPTSWGIGDFACLYDMVESACAKQMGAIGLNPLHPLFPSNPAHRSPYSPTSRCFLNTMYIAVDQVDGYQDTEALEAWMAGDEFKKLLSQVQQSDLIDYETVGYLKFKALRMIFEQHKEQLLSLKTEMGEDFARFRATEGTDLELLATYDALYHHFVKDEQYGWFAWPEEYHNPDSESVRDFVSKNEDEVHYYAWLQYVADKQLRQVTEFAKQKGMPVGLYLDLAVGCDGGGAEVWSNQPAYLAGASVGAPPDAMNVLGQDWGLTPINPFVLKQQEYKPLAKALRCSMKYAGALRIDHILGFMRQYWVAPGMAADQGIYIRFPMDEMFRIIARESHLNQCVVIGEDLGTVPEGFDKIMEQAGLLSYKVLFFERWESGLYKRPELYPEQSMATVSTHDLHTLVGWWTGRDLQWRRDLNLYPNTEMRDNEEAGRPGDREALIAAMVDYGLLNGEFKDLNDKERMHLLSLCVQRFLGESNSAIQLIPLEDALELEEQVNIPGTIEEHPNWKRKIPIPVDAIWHNKNAAELIALMQKTRPLV